jgi:hypothetical protein
MLSAPKFLIPSAFNYIIFIISIIFFIAGKQKIPKKKKKNHGLSAAVLLSAFDGAIRSTPQPPYRPSSFACQIIYGGFAWYLLLSPIPSAIDSLLGFYHTICYPHQRCIMLIQNISFESFGFLQP